MTHILIVGGAGGFGSALAHRLLDNGYSIRILDVTAPSHAVLLTDVIDKVDYRWKAAQDINTDDIEGCSTILNLSAQADVPLGLSSPRYTAENNVGSVVALLEACRRAKIEKFIHASSGSEYAGHYYLPIDEKHPLTPATPYSASKAAQELFCWAYHRAYRIPIILLGSSVIYGPNMRKEIFIMKWLWNLLHHKQIVIEGGMSVSRDPIFLTDVLDGWLLAIEAEPFHTEVVGDEDEEVEFLGKKIIGEKFLLSYGVEWGLNRIAELCCEATDKPYGKYVLGAKHRYGEEGVRQDFSIAKAKQVLGYNPKIDLKTGLAKTVEWMKSEKW